MLRSSLMLSGLVALGATAPAQQLAPTTKLQTVTAPVRDAGTYHLATRTWTRKASAANVGADTLYDNTCSTGYYFQFSSDTVVDEGRLPSPNSPNNLNSKPGCQAQYNIDGFQIGYCTDQDAANFGNWIVNFYQSYVGCATVVGVTPTAGFVIGGLPSSPTIGTLQCWIVNLDLDAPPQTASLAFNMAADGTGSYTTEAASRFGYQFDTTTVADQFTGPLISGDTATCQRFDGTRWDPVVNYLEAGTGMSNADAFRIEGGTTTAGCYWFGGSPFGGFFLEVYGDACVPTAPGTVYCSGDGTGTACPCANTAPAGDGCLNSLGTGGRLRGAGTASIATDTVVLTGTQMPNSSCLYFQGTTQQNGGAGTAFGDGLRCAGGTVRRLGTKTNVAGTSSYPVGADQPISVKGAVTAPGTRTYQAWYRNAAAFCTASTFNLTNGYQIVWGA